MKCPRCGNEVGPEEAFCGQCGTPTSPSSQQTEMVNTTPPPRNGLLSSYPTNGPSVQRNTYDFGEQSPINTQNPPPPPSARPSTPQQPAMRQSAPNQEGGFYQDATEAMSVLPNNPGQGYPAEQQPFPNPPIAGGYPTAGQPGQYGYQAEPAARPQTGSYPGQGYPQPPFQSTQGYDQGMGGGFGSQPQRQRNNTAIIILSVCLAVALISVVGFGALYLFRNQNNSNSSQGGQGAVSTLAPTATATTAPTPTPTLAPTATTAPTPTPTLVPTPAADANFTWCGQTCITNGFSTEYPASWKAGTGSDAQTIQFVNPAQADQYAAFKTPGQTSSSAGDLVANDVQTNFAAKSGYTAVSPNSTVTISGETWVKAVATYQGDTQKERVEVYATVHQGKAYIIELQAPDAQFDTSNTQYFVNMIGRFQFQ